ncbi:nucleic acid binding [Zea mays]|uniref:Nucleic acid binding n=1 Tax=Zea mays TaxID=4577 RepID=A0A1D6PXD2_MAIZE|nr:nucleic acid binding [Zea mays]
MLLILRYNGLCSYSTLTVLWQGLDDLSHSHKFAVGTRVQAVWSEDGEWYNATVEALTPNGYYVAYDGWGNSEEVCSFFLKVIYFSFKNRVGIFIQQLLQVHNTELFLILHM